jgi:hypothetical protein
MFSQLIFQKVKKGGNFEKRCYLAGNYLPDGDINAFGIL